MATNYPGSLDSFTNPSAGDALTSPSHSAQHANANDAIEAVQAELGTDPSGASATVKARFEAIEANDWVTSARIAADAVGTSEIANSAVTDAKLAGSITPSKVTGTALVASTVDAKGDLLVGTADNTVGRLAAGADGTLLGYDSSTASGLATYRIGNLLPLNVATGTDAEAATTGFSASGTVTLASSTAQAFQGSRSLLVTSTDAPASGVIAAGTVGTVTPGDTYAATVRVLRGVGSRTHRVEIVWRTSGGTLVSIAVSSYATCTAWTEVSVSGVAPATASYANIYVTQTAGSASDTFYVDAFSFHRGAGGTWSLPGTPIVHTGIRPNPADTSQVQIWNDATATWITV